MEVPNDVHFLSVGVVSSSTVSDSQTVSAIAEEAFATTHSEHSSSKSASAKFSRKCHRSSTRQSHSAISALSSADEAALKSLQEARPHQTGPPGLAHDSPRTPNVHISGPRRFNSTKIHERTPREGKMKKNCGGKRAKKREILGFWAPPFGAPPTLCRPKIQHPKNGRNRNWPKSKLAEVELAELAKKSWPKSKLAEVDRDRGRRPSSGAIRGLVDFMQVRQK